MFALRLVLMALGSLRANALRSILATLGVVIGVAAVVAAISILEGSSRDVSARFSNIGADQITVVPDTRRRGTAFSEVNRLTYDDARAIARASPAIATTCPIFLTGAVVKFSASSRGANIMGTTPEFATINSFAVQVRNGIRMGRFISAQDVSSSNEVVVLGAKLAEQLFRGGIAVGAPVRIGNKQYRVIGVMEEKGSLGSFNPDTMAFVPITTALRRFGVKNISSITVQAASADPAVMDQARSEIKRALRSRHGVRAGEDDGFVLFTQEQIQKQFGQVVQIFQIVLYSIAGISLVVGGIGIANIMLVSVTERTREIGVRIAVGARRSDILLQFLFEAAVISVLGGAFGALMGHGMAKAIEWAADELFKTYTADYAIRLALGMALLTGLISGIYPAYKASRLDPVEALRYE